MLSISSELSQDCTSPIGLSVTPAEQPWFVLSAAKQYRLAMSYNPAISHFYSFEADQTRTLALAIPDGCVDIVIDCDPVNPKVKVCGSTLEARSAGLTHKHPYFGVRFTLGVFPEFLNTSADELVNHELQLLELVPEFEQVLEALVNEPDFLKQAAIFERFYAGKTILSQSDLTLTAARAICNERGVIRSKQLEDLTGFSIRTIQRQFQSDIGMSPKAFSRIVRCQSAVNTLNQNDSISFSELACELGFSDQPHFLREFKKLVSTTPLEFQRQMQERSRLRLIERA